MSLEELPSPETSVPFGYLPPLTPIRLNTVHVVKSRRLVLSSTSLRELKGHTTASQLAVDLRVGVQAVVDTTALLLVENDLESLGTILLGAQTLADNLDGEDKIGQDGVVDSGQGTRARALLSGGVARAGGALGAGENAARGEDQDVAVRELLLELAGEAALIVSEACLRR